jgi:hypothetical protein
MVESSLLRGCIFILSMKSCGSSILQQHIVKVAGARVMAKTRHRENETLYWTKAASVLGLPQIPLENSQVPLPKAKAEAMLAQLVRDNAPAYSGPLSTEADFFAAWTAIVNAHPGLLVEKSPHHLYEPAVVDLMERYADQVTSFGVRFIGLIRNPTDMLYSSWRRIGIVPEREERHWIRSYELLRSLHKRRPDLVSLIRYEDIVRGEVDLVALLGLHWVKPQADGAKGFHSRSIGRWRKDRKFGYTPSDEARQLANDYGYSDEEVMNPHVDRWWLHRVPRAAVYSAFWRLPISIRKRIRFAAQMVLRPAAAGVPSNARTQRP